MVPLISSSRANKGNTWDKIIIKQQRFFFAERWHRLTKKRQEDNFQGDDNVL